ncbi:hypothetical protein [Pedobacter gandavensis]|uniref:hypothetical protein n=1 Tax=Pedobacter gandavensis TaxID=2679963 RepID=UPI00292E9875|nr:hypothetical protein [Pedobacter gandavensis]
MQVFTVVWNSVEVKEMIACILGGLAGGLLAAIVEYKKYKDRKALKMKYREPNK